MLAVVPLVAAIGSDGAAKGFQPRATREVETESYYELTVSSMKNDSSTEGEELRKDIVKYIYL